MRTCGGMIIGMAIWVACTAGSPELSSSASEGDTVLFAPPAAKKVADTKNKGTQTANGRHYYPVKKLKAPSADTSMVHGQRKLPDSPVFVDDKLVGFLTITDLPPWLKPEVSFSEGVPVHKFSYTDYIQSLGIPISKVKAVLLHGGRQQIARIPGSALPKLRGKKWQFRFGTHLGGKPLALWSPPSQFNVMPDMIHKMTIVVDKPLPRLHPTSKTRVVDDKGADYKTPQIRGGVRIYVDGKLVTLVKRNILQARYKDVTQEKEDLLVPLSSILDGQGYGKTNIATVQLLGLTDVSAVLPGDTAIVLRATKKASGTAAAQYTGPSGKPLSTQVTAVRVLTKDYKKFAGYLGGLSAQKRQAKTQGAQ